MLAHFFYLTNIAYERSFAESISNSANVKSLSSGTKVANQVARKVLDFWLPPTIQLPDKGVRGVSSLSSLLQLPKAHFGHIFSVLVKIIWQKRTPNGRVIRDRYQKQYNKLVLTNFRTPVKTFNIYEDPELKVLYDSLRNKH